MPADLPRSVVFIDLDHTLLEGPFETVVFPQILGEISRQTGLGYEDLLSQVRQENLKRMAGPPFSPVQAMDWDDIFSQAAASLGARLRFTAVELVQAYLRPPYIHLHEGAREALERLSQDRPRRAVVLATKGLRKYQLPLLQAFDLTSFFDELITPDSYLALKYSPAFYGSWPQRTRLQVMVGDNYQDDVLPAHRFGFKTIWVNRSPRQQPDGRWTWDLPEGQSLWPDATIVSLVELPDWVCKFEREVFTA